MSLGLLLTVRTVAAGLTRAVTVEQFDVAATAAGLDTQVAAALSATTAAAAANLRERGERKERME
jgi:hypothetical protein